MLNKNVKNMINRIWTKYEKFELSVWQHLFFLCRKKIFSDFVRGFIILFISKLTERNEQFEYSRKQFTNLLHIQRKEYRFSNSITKSIYRFYTRKREIIFFEIVEYNCAWYNIF